MIVHVKTPADFECDFEKEAFNDMELLEAIEDMDKGEAMAFVPFVRKLFKPADKARLYDFVREADGRAGREGRPLAAAHRVDAGLVLEEHLRAILRIEPHRARDGVDLRVADAAEAERRLEREGVEQAPGGVDELAARGAEPEEEESRGGGHRRHSTPS